MDGKTETNAQRPRPSLVKALVVGCLVLIALLTLAGVFGPDPRDLLLRQGMTQSEVAMLMGKPDIYDFYDDPGDGRERPGWFYTYIRSEITGGTLRRG